MASYGMATIHFDGRGIHSANKLTVYIDGVKKGYYYGGSTYSVQVTPGYHEIRILVYNDAAEDSYYLGPFHATVEAGTEYDMTVGKSGGGGGGSGGGGRGGGSSNAGAGFGCLILILIAVGLFSGLRSCISDFLSPSPVKNTPPAQVTESPEALSPSDDIPEDWYAEDDGFIFPNSDTELIEQWEVERLSDQELTYAINELYARHGYIFRSAELRGYYEQFGWYTGTVPADEFSVEVFNQIEQQNWGLLVSERDARKASS